MAYDNVFRLKKTVFGNVKSWTTAANIFQLCKSRKKSSLTNKRFLSKLILPVNLPDDKMMENKWE